jgi:hypothetical protein
MATVLQYFASFIVPTHVQKLPLVRHLRMSEHTLNRAFSLLRRFFLTFGARLPTVMCSRQEFKWWLHIKIP